MTVLEKTKAKTSEKFGKRPEERSVEELVKNGIVVIDKPKGPTSHEVVSLVKKILNIKRAGHSGTLDPKVTGVLPIALENATKALQILLLGGKEYVCLMHLHKKVEEDRIQRVCREFKGKIYQKPPVKSAVKRRLRVREIYEIKVLEIEEKDVLMKVSCEAGTYMRKLCHDIGLVLGVGANMEELRRIRVSNLDESISIYLHDLKDAKVFWEEGDESYIRSIIFPVEKCVEGIPKIWIQDSAIDAVCHGANLAIPGVVKLSSEIEKNDFVAIMSLKDELVAMGKAIKSSREIIKGKKGLAVDVSRVIMKRGTYPKGW